MPSVNGVGSYVDTGATNAVPDSKYSPQTTVATGEVVQPIEAPSPVSSLAGGIGSVLLFPGRLLVQQFVGPGGDPLDMSHMPVTILLSLGAWYGLYWYLTKPGGLLHSHGEHK